MLRTAIVWRESVYKNDFKCNKCGHVVANKKGWPADDTLYDPDGQWLFCPECHNCVGREKEVDDDGPSGLRGYFGDFMRKKRGS